MFIVYRQRDRESIWKPSYVGHTLQQCWIPFLLLPNLLVILVRLNWNSIPDQRVSVVSNFWKNSRIPKSAFFWGGNLSNFHFKVLPTSLGIRCSADLGIRRGDGCDVQCGARSLPNHRLRILKNAGKIMENRTYGWSPWKKMKLKIWENHGQSTVFMDFHGFFSHVFV